MYKLPNKTQKRMGKNSLLEKIKFGKDKDLYKSVYSLVSVSEVTEGALEVWRGLPEQIRQDPSLASFRQEHERLRGKCWKIHFSISHF